MNTEFQNPPDDEDEMLPYKPQGPKAEIAREGTLTIRKQEGHCILELAKGPGPQNMVWTQSAGSEMDDALEKARKVWKFSSCVPVRQEEEIEVWTVIFND